MLLHHLDVTQEDKYYAVNENHNYERTNHFRLRLSGDAKAPLKKQKHIKSENYNKKKIYNTIHRAKNLHTDKHERCTKCLTSTVYILLEKIIDMIPKDN